MNWTINIYIHNIKKKWRMRILGARIFSKFFGGKKIKIEHKLA